MTKQSFLKGTLILLAAGILNRILGFIPRMTLPRVIGAEGVGLYQMGWPFLIVILTLITGGIPLAVAKLVAEAEAEHNEKRSRSILKISLALSMLLAALFTLLCLISAKWISTHILTDSRVYETFLCMTPIIPMAAVSSVFRGYFQGKQNMIPTAISQTVETMVRIVFVLIFAYLMLPYGIPMAAAGAMVGVLTGEVCGMLVLIFHYNNKKQREGGGLKAHIGTSQTGNRLSNLRKILRISIPVTLSKLVGATSYLFESILLTQSLLLAGISTSVATAQYGVLQGMILPILLLPSALTNSLSVSLIPSLSAALARKDTVTIHKRLNQALRLALITGAPFAVLMFVLAEPICSLMYKDPNIAVMLKMMAPIALFIYLQAPLQAALQALDKPGNALVNTLVGSIVKLGLIYFLASRPEIGILGAIMAININIVLVTLLHAATVMKTVRFTLEGGDFLKVGLSMLLTGSGIYLSTLAFAGQKLFVLFLLSASLGLVLYLLALIALGLLHVRDFSRILHMGKNLIK